MCRYQKEVLSTLSNLLFFFFFYLLLLNILQKALYMNSLLYFSFFDKKASGYLPAWPCSSTAEAMRAVHIGVQEGKSTWAKFPADFDLYLVGHWDHVQGLMTPPTSQGPQFLEHVTTFATPEVSLGKA